MLHVHRSDRADGLITALQALLADPPDDPFAPELVSVPTRGMERWLTQRLSNGLGICANVEFPFPHRLTGDAVAAASGIDPDADPWLPERLVWPLLEVVEDSLGEPWLATLAAHLEVDPSRRFAAVRHLAGLFDRYALHRPELIRAWSRRGRALAGAAVAAAARARRRARPRRACAAACARLRSEPERGRAARALLAVRPDAAAHHPPRGPARDRRAPRRPPVPAAPVARAVGADRASSRRA